MGDAWRGLKGPLVARLCDLLLGRTNDDQPMMTGTTITSINTTNSNSDIYQMYRREGVVEVARVVLACRSLATVDAVHRAATLWPSLPVPKKYTT